MVEAGQELMTNPFWLQTADTIKMTLIPHPAMNLKWQLSMRPGAALGKLLNPGYMMRMMMMMMMMMV